MLFNRNRHGFQLLLPSSFIGVFVPPRGGNVSISKDFHGGLNQLRQDFQCIITAILRQFHFLTSDARCSRGAIKYHRHLALLADGYMTGKLHGDLALSVVGGFEGETSSGKCIFELDCNQAAIRTVTNPPDVAEIALRQIYSRYNLGGVRTIDICATERELNVCRACAQCSCGHLAFPTIKMFELLGIFRAVVDVLAKVRKCRGAAHGNAACSRADDVLVSRSGGGCRGELLKQHTSVELQLRKCVLRDHSKFAHMSSLILSKILSSNVNVASLNAVVCLVYKTLAPRGAAFKPYRTAITRDQHSTSPDALRKLLRLLVWRRLRLRIKPEVDGKAYRVGPKSPGSKGVCAVWENHIIRHR
nr:MAG TPA: hypothetical protein [Caudoviricetes sp.]